jgi:Calcineurin-like phosphoesterase
MVLASASLALPGGGSSSTATRVTLKPVADALVSSAAPRGNFGRARVLGIDRRPLVLTYLRFRVRGLAGPVRRATLRLYATRVRGHGLRVSAVRSHRWSERRVTFASAPRVGAGVRTKVSGRGWVEVDVSRLVRRAGVVDLALSFASPAGKIAFASREAGARAPRLVVSDAVSNDPVIAAAGNIACDPTSPDFNGGNGTATDCHQKATSDLLAGTKLAAVLTLGDAQYDCGGLGAYQQAFAPSWGRFLSITHPTPGNHDYATTGGGGCDPTGRAAGYFSYFGAAAGQYGRSYYSFEIGRWHIVSLDSQCSAVGGCGNGSPEETWLRADLAAHPAKCTLAFWHYPIFSSGIEGSRPDAAAFWSDLDNAGAEVVLSAHEHDYERFAPQHLGGVAGAKGIREFIVGTGGRMRHQFGTVRANSQVRDNSTWGVLELTLHPASYDWRFVPVTRGGFTDSGSASCH